MKIAVVGATGAVGREMLNVLARSRFADDEILPLASERSAGTLLPYRDTQLTVSLLEPEALEDVQLALFSASGSISKSFAPRAAEHGCVVVDNSSAFRMDPQVPLVVPEINAAALSKHGGIIANPNCSTIILVLALAPLAKHYGLREVVVSTYQAVSGAGQKAIDELRSQQADPALAAGPCFPHRIADNVLPFVDSFLDGGHTREEQKMVLESRKILDLPELSVRVTCVRVPVERAHSEAVSVTLDRPISVDEARQLFGQSAGLIVEDDPAAQHYPMPLIASGRDAVGVGRIRQPENRPDQLDFWLCGDQLLKGAALNAVQIAEHLHPS